MKHINTFEGFLNEAFTESQIAKLLSVSPISITAKPNEVTVVVSGNDLGYDDNQYYKMTWSPDDSSVDSGTYKDARCTKLVTADTWSEEVNSLEDFAAVINGEADGEFE